MWWSILANSSRFKFKFRLRLRLRPIYLLYRRIRKNSFRIETFFRFRGDILLRVIIQIYLNRFIAFYLKIKLPLLLFLVISIIRIRFLFLGITTSIRHRWICFLLLGLVLFSLIYSNRVCLYVTLCLRWLRCAYARLLKIGEVIRRRRWYLMIDFL